MTAAEPRIPPKPISNEAFGMVLFLVVELMFFAGLASTYTVLRTGTANWKPDGLASLMSPLSMGNTVLLFVSAGSYFFATRALRREDTVGFRLHLSFTLALAVTFVGIQVYESGRLLDLLPMSDNLFGSVFYTYIGLHALHVVGGVALLAHVLFHGFRGQYNRYRHTAVTLTGWYWYFVVLVWVFIYLALYVY